MGLEAFNSRFLELVQKNYKGPFYSKFLQALDVLAKTGSMEQACSQLFRTSIQPIEAPEYDTLINFGKGNLAQDYMTLLYIDDLLGKSFDLIKQKRYQDALKRLATSDIFPKFDPSDNISIIDSMMKAVKRFPQKDIQFRFQIFLAMVYTCLGTFPIKFPRKYRTNKNTAYSINDKEDLAFLGVCSMLDCYFTSQGRGDVFDIDFTVNVPKNRIFSSQNFILSQNQLAAFQLEKNSGQGPITSYPEIFDQFLRINKNYELKTSKQDLNTSISNLLSSTSFIWDQQVFGISPQEVEAMNTNQRLLFLVQNKSKVIERCLDYLLNAASSKVKTETGIIFNASDISKLKRYEKTLQSNKSKMIQLSQQVEGAMQDISLLESKYRQFEKSKKKAKDALYQLAANMGQSETKTLQELLSYVEKDIPTKTPLPKQGMDQLVHKLLEEYRRSFFQSASYKERAKESQENLKFLQGKLENVFAKITNAASEYSLEKLFDSSRFLEVYSVFSFIIFNEDLFPDISFKNYNKEQGLKKLSKIFNKSSNEKRLAIQAFDRMTRNTPGHIEDVLNKQAKKLFRAFRPSSDSYKIKTLSDGDLNAIRDVTQNVLSLSENGNKQAFENFDRLTEIIKDLLLRDEVFLGSIDQLESRYSLDKIASLQAHMQACLMFIEGDEATISTGLPRQIGFKKLLQDILYSLGEESIKISKLKEGEHVVQALKNFSLPLPDKETFRQAIQREVISTSINDITSRTIEIQQLPVEESTPELRQMKALLDLFGNGIAQRLKNIHQGSSEFLASKAPKKKLHKGVAYAEVMRHEFDPSKVRLSMADEGFLNKRFREKTFQQQEVEEAVKQFILDNDIQTAILNPDSFWQMTVHPEKWYDSKFLAGRITVYQQIKKEYERIVEKLQERKSYKIVPINQGNEKAQANVFSNQTLFQFYEQQQNSSNENRALTQAVYQQFLPIFIASFFDDIQGLRTGQNFFMEKKFDLLRNLPDAEKTYAELRSFLEGKYAQLQNLSTYLEKSLQEGVVFDEGWMEEMQKYIYESFELGVESTKSALKEFSLAAIIFTIGMAITLKGQFTLAAICGVLAAFAWMVGGKPLCKQMYAYAKETVQYYLTDKYTDKGVNQAILDLINVSFRTEIQSIPKFETLEQRMSFISFLQEEFSILRNLNHDLSEFPSRINYLVPNTVANMNFSAMAMNFFYMFNKELFLVAPPELLKNASSPLFMAALEEYLQAYQDLLLKKQQAYEGSEEDAKISYAKETPFSRMLKEESAQKKLFLEFSRTSNVHKFLQTLRSDLGATYRIDIAPGQLVPLEKFKPSSLIANLQNFLKLSKELLKQEQQFYGYMAFSLKEAKAASLPMNAENENKALQGLICSYYIMRHTLSEAKRLYDTQKLPEIESEDIFLQGVGETAESILTSKLSRETLGIIRKTLEFAVESDIYGAREGLRFLREIEDSINRFLKTGVLSLPPYQEVNAFVHSLSTIARQVNENPQILFPILMEYSRNKNLFLPQIIWQQAVESLETSGLDQVAIKGNYTSKILYLTNSDAEIFFASRQGRGFALSPFVVEALQETIQKSDNLDLLKYLGLMSNQVDLMRESQGAIPRFLNKIRSFLPGSRQEVPAIENNPSNAQNESNQPQGVPQMGPAPGQSYIPANQPKPFENAPINQQPLGQPQSLSGNNLPKGQQNPQISQEQPPGQNASQPIQGPENQALSGQTAQQSMNSGILPIPMMNAPLGGQEQINPQMDQKQEQMEVVPEQSEMQAENQNMVMVNADGGSGSHSIGGFGGDDSPIEGNPNALQQAENSFNQAFNQRPQGPNMPIGQPYQNPLNQNYQPVVPNQGFPYGKAAMVGGGMLLGAALLSQMLKKDDKPKGKR